MNSYLDKQIKVLFGKSFSEMSDEEKVQITEITLPYKNFSGELTGVSISELLQFPELKKCLISGFELNDDELEVLKQISTLRGIQFSSCDFSDITEALGDVEVVVIDNCSNIPKKLLQKNGSLRLFRTVNQRYFDVENLLGCNALEEAYLQRSTLVNLLSLKMLKSLKVANFNGSKMNLLALTHLRKLKDLKIEYDKELEKDGIPDFSR